MQVTRSFSTSLPKNLSVLDHNELRDARRHRDDRMSVLFRSWPSLTDIELRELRKLSDERQRLARHVGILRGPPRTPSLVTTQTEPVPVIAVSEERDFTTVQDLDWQGFVTAHFPGSGRHDLKAITAYSDYKRSRVIDGRSATEGASSKDGGESRREQRWKRGKTRVARRSTWKIPLDV